MTNKYSAIKYSALSKRNILTFTIFCILNFVSFSQKNRNYIGIDFNPTIATQLNSPINKSNILRFSPNFGIHMHHELSKRKLYFEYGLKQMNRGYGYTVDVYNLQGQKFGEYQFEKHLKYICLPLTFGVKSKFMYIEMGPSFDYLYSIKEFNSGKWKELDFPENKFTLSANLSFGTMFEPKNMRGILITIGAYANITLKEYYLNAGLRLGIKYRLKKKTKNYRRN